MADDEEKCIHEALFLEDNSPCVCSRVWEKNNLTGWRPNEERKGTKKRFEASRGESRNYASLRRERTTLAPTDGFVFRHYESSKRYIEQYRENHCSTCMEREIEERPVLGINVPDPYLPRIATSSALVERMKIIKTLSEYYRVAGSNSNCSELKNICLTGKRTDPTDRRALTDTPRRNSEDSLPLIKQGILTQDENALTTVCENEEREINHEIMNSNPVDNKKLEILRLNKSNTDFVQKSKLELISIHKSSTNKAKASGSRENRIRKLPTPQVIYKFERPSAKEAVYKAAQSQTILPQVPHPQFSEHDRSAGRERILETLRIGRRIKPVREESNEEDNSDDLRKNLGSSGGGQLSSRGNLYLGTTVKTPNKNTKNHVNVGKCEVFSSANPIELLQSITRKPKFSTKTTAFIKILGQATGPPPKTKLKPDKKTKLRNDRSKPDTAAGHYRLPLQYVRNFGKHNFHHVLEARSYKPEHRELGTNVIPN